MNNEKLLKFLRRQIKKWAVYRYRIEKSLKTGRGENIDLDLLHEFADGHLQAFIAVYHELTI
jgi:hypothetical protein